MIAARPLRAVPAAVALIALLALGAPAAALAASPPRFVMTQWLLRVPAGTPAGFLARAIDPDGDPVTLSWAFDDGAVATGERVAHAWTTPGSHAVTVTATDATGLGTSRTFSVEVTADAPAATAPPAPAGVLLRRPGPAPAATARLTLGAGALRLAPSGTVDVPVACDTAADCVGRISIAHGGRRVATAPYAVRAGGAATVRLRLPAAAADRLRRRGATTVVVTVAAAGQAPVRSPRTLRRG
jgi:hypothetical protein